MNVFVTGATGFLGRALIPRLLARGDRVIALSRGEHRTEGVEWLQGDPAVAGPWCARVAGCHAVVHLAGEPVAAKRWSSEQKKRIMDSRIEGTRTVVEAMGDAPAGERPRVLVAANGIDWYGFDDTDEEYPEDKPHGQGFLQQVCIEWQREAEVAREHGARVVVMRTGVILGRGEGALRKLITPFKLFVGGPIGSGKQWLSWMHVDDAIGAYLHALDGDTLSGPVNLCAPGALRQKEFARLLGRVLGRPSWLPVPGFMLRLAVGEIAHVLLHGRCATPLALERAGYAFKYPEATPALAEACG